MSRRHCMVVHAHYPLGEVRVEREAKALIAAGYQVDVIALRAPGEPGRETIDGIRVLRLPVRRKKDRGFVGQSFEYLRFFWLALLTLSWRQLRRRYATVQVHNLPDFLVFAALVPKLTGAGVILDIHDLMPEFMAARLGRDLAHPAVRAVALQERWATRFADSVVTVTTEWRDTLVKRGVPAEKLSVVMNLADPQVFFPRARDRENTPGFTVMYHGTLTERYGIDLAIRAVVALRPEIPDLRFRVMGSGEALEGLRAQVEAADASGFIVLPEGFVPMEELVETIRHADLGLVPNRSDVFTDGILPTKLLEYVSLGVPVVASRTSGISSYFDDSMVEFFAPGDVDDLMRAILLMYRDRRRAVAKAARAMQFNRDHPWDSLSRRYVSLVETVGGLAA